MLIADGYEIYYEEKKSFLDSLLTFPNLGEKAKLSARGLDSLLTIFSI